MLLCQRRDAGSIPAMSTIKALTAEKLWVKPPFASSSLAILAINEDLVKWSNTAVKLNVPSIFIGPVVKSGITSPLHGEVMGSNPDASTILLGK